MRRSIPPLYQQAKFHGHKPILKLTAELMILFAEKTPGSRSETKTSASGGPVQRNPLQVLGQFKVIAEIDGKAGGLDLKVIVTNASQLNLLGSQALVEL